MTADRARVSYDATRQYRSVVAQQGRVTLEADTNEAATIASEALRLETIDVIGPTGTPDNGYLPGSGKGPGGVSIGPGIFYLGGWRLELDKAIDLASQPDWLDQPPPAKLEKNFLVALLLNEQTVSAAEDEALREVALGGPDTAARTRLMQHFLRLPLPGKTCAEGAALIAKTLAADGVTLDPATLQLLSKATLQVGFVTAKASTDPCKPTAAGGYLGADNQLVHVTIIAYDANAKTGTLLWGWNNASILYRARMKDSHTLTLSGMPVDGEHAPQLGQAVEILRSQANLDDNDTSDIASQNFVAAPEGFVTTVAQAYSFDTGELSLVGTIPKEYKDGNPLFIRLWQAQVPFVAGQATPLDDVSGITVTITLPVLPTHIALRPYWRFAVRPSKPVRVYPLRYHEKPQPPDGPRQWIADLAVMAANPQGATLVQDCRVPFVPLTQQVDSECCTLTLTPKEVAAKGGLQAVLDSLAGKKSGVSLLAGTYPLTAPLKLIDKHAGLALEACGGTVILQAQAQNLAPFAAGLIEVTGTSSITLRGLTLAMPAVPASTGAGNRQVSTGITANAAASLTIEECVFQLTVPSKSTAAVTGAGIAVVGQSLGLTVRRNSFVGGALPPSSAVYGIMAGVAGNNATTSLDGAEINDNLFRQFTAGVSTLAKLGLVRIINNRVVDCMAGFSLADSNFGAAGELARRALAAIEQSPQNAALAASVINALQVPMLATAVDTMALITAHLPPPPPPPAVSEAARRVLLQDVATRGAAAWDAIVSPPGAAGAEAAQAGTRAASVAPGDAATTTTGAALITKEAADNMLASLDTLNEIAITAELAAVDVVPVLHVSGNDVSLAAAPQTQQSPPAGIQVILSPGNQSSTVLMTANRVLTADGRSSAASLAFPVAAAVTGNVFMQTGVEFKPFAPAFSAQTDPGAPIEVMANVIHIHAKIVPARTVTAPTTDWNFLNTVG